MRPLVLTALVALVGCECGGEGPAPAEPRGQSEPLSAYFPSAPGDRWLYVAEEERVTRAVVEADPVDAEGPRRVVFMGDDLMGPRFHQVDDEGVVVTSPDGEAIGTLLDAPMEQGHQWSYVFGDVGCEARYTSVDEEVQLAGLTLGSCVVVERQCTHPAGKPFPVETAEIHRETYCPYIGRVRERIRIEPPPPGSESAERDDRLVFYRVQGSPAPEVPETFDCDAFLVVSGDVSAACGRPLPLRGSQPMEGGCRLTFGTPGAPPLVVAARRLEADATQEDVDALVGETEAFVGTDELASHGYAEGRHALAVAAPLTACSEAQLDRMGPLLQSVVRR